MSTTDDYKKVMLDIRSGNFKPVYMLHGEESFFIDRIAEERILQAQREGVGLVAPVQADKGHKFRAGLCGFNVWCIHAIVCVRRGAQFV